MNVSEFQQSLDRAAPAPGCSRALQAMWHQAKGDWAAAHRLAQADKGTAGSWVHAYLHRVEGDKGNAAYWYRLAGKPFCELSLDDEWQAIVTALIGSS